MNLVERVQAILLKPKATWPEIDAEPADAASLYKNYVMILALIPALASFIGLSLIGVGAFGVSFRVPLASGLANMIVGYVLSLVMVFVLALIIEWADARHLADLPPQPTYDQTRHLKSKD